MIKIEEALKLDDMEQLKNETKIREELYSKLVGDLWRSVISDEIMQLRQRMWNVKYF